MGKRRLSAQPLRIVARGHQQRGGGVGAHALAASSAGAASATRSSRWRSSVSISALSCWWRSAMDLRASFVAASGPGSGVVGRNAATVLTSWARFIPATDHGLVRRSEEHTSELQSRQYLVCRLLLETTKNLTD